MLPTLKRAAYDASTSALRAYYRAAWGMSIGDGVRIARSARLDTTNPKGVHIGADTAIGPGAVIFTHDFPNGRHLQTSIGRNCFIGGNAMIMAGVTVGDGCIVSGGSVVFSDVPPGSVVAGNPARIVKSGIITGRWGIQNPKFLAKEGVQTKAPAPRSKSQPATADHVASYLPTVSDMDAPFDDLNIDSFALISLRAEIEENEGSFISDEDWTAIECPADLRKFITRPKQARTGEVVGATLQRSYEVNMPQMALGGLSESWLYKEIGDLHWTLLTSSLGVRSRDIADQAGDRLYATFTRIRYRATAPLTDILENDRLDASAAMTRFGAGMFFSSAQIQSETATFQFEIMSSFAKFGETGENTSLVKGQPAIPDGFPVPSLPEMPNFALEYRERRATDPGPAIFETEYEILPQHDINGVGLLYFAAYPVISDICLMRHFGPGSALEWSPVARDIGYFANSGAADRLIYRLHSDKLDGDTRTCTGTLSRMSDGKRMALVEVELRRR